MGVGATNGTGDYFSKIISLGRDYAHAHYMGPEPNGGVWKNPNWEIQWSAAMTYLQNCRNNSALCPAFLPLP